MKVNDPNITGTPPESIGGPGLDRAQQTRGIGRRGAGGSQRVGEGGGDSVGLSNLGSQLRAANVDAPGHAEQIEKLSLEVETGRYEVDARALSHTLVENALKPAA